MSKKATSDTLDLLHAAVAHALMEKIESGEATAADIAAAAKFLKDNGVSRLLDRDSNETGAAVEGNIPDPAAEPDEDFDNVVALFQ